MYEAAVCMYVHGLLCMQEKHEAQIFKDLPGEASAASLVTKDARAKRSRAGASLGHQMLVCFSHHPPPLELSG